MSRILLRSLLITMVLAPTTLLVTSCKHFEVADAFHEKAKTWVVKSNMWKVREAAEAFAKDHTYMYPTQIDDEFKSYFEGGDPKSKKPGKAPNNPFTGTDEWPQLGFIVNLEESRNVLPGPLKRGILEYTPLENGKSYAIRGGSEADKAIGAEDGGAETPTMIISRDSKPPSK